MWGEQDKLWIHYHNNIIAADIDEARFLAARLRYISINKIYAHCTEIIDLQSYKIIRHPGKVRSRIAEVSTQPFIFAACRN